MSADTRLYVIMAREAPAAVVFRRGPSKQVQLIRWNTANDTFECGQWFKGRIYERRCDLSPDGRLLLYFAANYKKPYWSWSAISRPPFLTALALWPKGDTWGGGGEFVSNRKVALAHCPIALADGFSVPKWLTVEQQAGHPGWSEEEPRLVRDGWTLHNPGARADTGRKVWLEYSPPRAWRKIQPGSHGGSTVEMSVLGIKEQDGPWVVVEHSLLRPDGVTESLGRSEWADWEPSGDLLFAKGARLFRLPCDKRGALGPIESAEKLADFSSHKFEPRESPAEARVWPKR